MQRGGQAAVRPKHPAAPARAPPGLGQRYAPITRNPRLGLLDSVRGDRAIKPVRGPIVAARLWAHWRERNALIPVGAFQPQHDLLGVASEAELAEDLAQILMALGECSIEPLHAMLPGVDAQPLDQPEPDIWVGRVAVTAAIGREHHDILLGFAAATDRLGRRAHAALAVDEGCYIAPTAL